jgi:5-methylcytosine-specific restriction enzyme A
MKDRSIEALRPHSRRLVMDLVAEAGLDVSDWPNYKGKHPASNPKYCYEWVFSGDDRIAACLWFDNLKTDASGEIIQKVNLWSIIKRHEDKGGRPTVVRRARTLDEALQRAYGERLLVRAIIVDGDQADLEEDEGQSSIVKTRLLDAEPWCVSEYDWKTGECVLVRGATAPKYIDQFTPEITKDSQRLLRQGFAYERNPEIRNAVLRRAAGCCEYCGANGFEAVGGSIYLETHHVVPLSEKGSDSTGNVVALCPEHHRQAHYGKDRELIQQVLLDRLACVASSYANG